jgi:hypothetical protein
MRNVSGSKATEKIKAHILCSINFFFPEHRVVYEIMWKNMAKPDRPEMTI